MRQSGSLTGDALVACVGIETGMWLWSMTRDPFVNLVVMIAFVLGGSRPGVHPTGGAAQAGRATARLCLDSDRPICGGSHSHFEVVYMVCAQAYS